MLGILADKTMTDHPNDIDIHGNIDGGNVNIGGTQNFHRDVHFHYPPPTEPSAPHPKTRVFLSYARTDDEPFVERLYNDLKGDFDVWWDRVSMPNRGLTFLQEICDAIDYADRLLLVAGPGAFVSDYVRDEWLYAYEAYKGINIAIRLGEYSEFPAQLTGFDAPDFRNDADYDVGLATLKRQLVEPIAPVGEFHGVPALPPHFFHRPKALDKLREMVIADVDKPTLIRAEKRTTTIEGMGGIGKSVLTTAFAYDRKVRFAFPDGIYWLTVGKNPDEYHILRELGTLMGDETSKYADWATARSLLQKALRNQRCLIVLDDVWEYEFAKSIYDLLNGTRARLIITTRDVGLAPLLACNSYKVNLLSREQSIEYLKLWVGEEALNLDLVAERFGGLVLGLRLAGARMRVDKLTATTYLKEFDRVSRITLKPMAGDDRNSNLLVSISLGIDSVFKGPSGNRILYDSLGIFPQDTALPEDLILGFWAKLRELLSNHDLQELLRGLANLSLIERRDDGFYRQHDILHEFAYEQLETGGQTKNTHDALLGFYGGKRVGHDWHTVADDGYLFKNLAYHLRSADRYDELKLLFADSHWMSVRVKQDGFSYEGYLSDVRLAWDTAKGYALNTWSEDLLLDCIRYAMICEVISELESQYIPEAVGRAVELGIEPWTADRLISIAIGIPNPEHRLDFSVRLLKYGVSDSRLRARLKGIMLDSLEAAVSVPSNPSAARPVIKEKIYGMIADVLSLDDITSYERLISALFKEQEHIHIARTIARVGKSLPDTLLEQLLDPISRLEFDHDQHESTAEIAIRGILRRLTEIQLDFLRSLPHLDGDAAQLISDYASGITGGVHDESKADLDLPEDLDLLVDTIEVPNLFFPDPWDIDREYPPGELSRLKRIAPRLTQEQIRRLCKRMFSENHAHYSAGWPLVIQSLAPHMSEETQVQLLNDASQMKERYDLFHTLLSDLAEHLTPKSAAIAYELVTQDGDGFREQSLPLLASKLEAIHLDPFLKPTISLSFGRLRALLRISRAFSANIRSDLLERVTQCFERGDEYVSTLDSFGLAKDIDWISAESALRLLEAWLDQHPIDVVESLPRILSRILKSGDVDLLGKATTLLANISSSKAGAAESYFQILYQCCMIEIIETAPTREPGANPILLDDTILRLLSTTVEYTNLRYFFAAISSCGKSLGREALDEVLAVILRVELDQSAAGDLSHLSDFLEQVSPGPEWYQRLFDRLDRIAVRNHFNIPLVHAVLKVVGSDERIAERSISFANRVPFEVESALIYLHVAAVTQDRNKSNEIADRGIILIQEYLNTNYRQEIEWALSNRLTEYSPYLRKLDLDDEVLSRLVLDNSIPVYLRAQILGVLGTGQVPNEERQMLLRTLAIDALGNIGEQGTPSVLEFVSKLALPESLQLSQHSMDHLYQLVVELTESWDWL